MVAALTAAALVIPLAAGVFNIVIAAEVGAAAMIAAWLEVPLLAPMAPAMVVTVLASAAIGLLLRLIMLRSASTRSSRRWASPRCWRRSS